MHPQASQLNYQRPLGLAITNGIKGRCPNCGEGKIYRGFIDVNAECSHCGEELHHHRADDLPPYLNIFLVGHIIVALGMLSMNYEWFGLWETTIGFSALALILSISLMRPIKGAVIGLQWALRMHGFEANEA